MMKRRWPLGRFLAVLAATGACVLGALGVRWASDGGGTDEILVVDLSRSAGGTPASLVEGALAGAGTEGRGRPLVRRAVVGFGRGAVVLQPLTSVLEPGSQAVARAAGLDPSVREESDVGAGLLRALELVTQDRPARVVLVGDGRYPDATLNALRAHLGQRGVELFVHPPPVAVPADVRLRWLGGSEPLRPLQPGAVRLSVEGDVPRPRQVRVLVGGTEFQVVVGGGGGTDIAATVLPPAESSSVLCVIVDPGGPDAWPANNRLEIPVVRGGSERLVGVMGEQAGPVGTLLAEAGLVVRSLDGDADANRQLAGLDGVVLADQSASRVSAGWWEALRDNVVGRGLGLLALGGPHAFRAGGYGASPLEPLLPLSSRPPRGRDVHLVLDRSGSMDAGDRLGRAVTAVQALLAGLGPEDRLQVWPFAGTQDAPVVEVPVGAAAYQERGMPKLWSLAPGGPTRVARALVGPLARAKDLPPSRDPILVVLSDLRDASLDEGEALDLRALREAFRGGILWLLLDPTPEAEARAGRLGGRVVPVASIVPELFLQQIESEGWRVEDLQSRWLEAQPDLGEAGMLRGWNPVRPGEGARVLLATPDDQPLAARAQRGAGTVVAVATDPFLEGWTRGLVMPLVRSVLPAQDGGFVATRRPDGGLDVLAPEAFAAWRLAIRSTEGPLPLVEVAPGRWEGARVPAGAVVVLETEAGPIARVPVPGGGDPEFDHPPNLLFEGTAATSDAGGPGPPLRWPFAAAAAAIMAGLLVTAVRGSR